MLCYLSDQALDVGDLGAVGRNRVCGCARLFVGQRVEGSNGFGACAGFARSDEDFGATGLEETGMGVSEMGQMEN